MGHPVVHFEIGCRDNGKTSAFFSSMFGWDMQPAGPATMIQTGAESGIQGHISALGHEPHH
jgi:predicted enzyme related to lactoylglutathione lyase